LTELIDPARNLPEVLRARCARTKSYKLQLCKVTNSRSAGLGAPGNSPLGATPP